jgi:hypothetical protein
MANEKADGTPKRLGKNGKPLGRPTYASQGKKKKSETQTTWKIDVPNGDISTNEFLRIQDNPSLSVRTIIREYIERNGMVDATCQPVEYRPVGRNASAKREQAEAANSPEPKFEAENEPIIQRETVRTPISQPTDEDDDDAIVANIFSKNKNKS